MRKLLAICLTLVLLTGCIPKEPAQQQYSATFLTLFDTVTTVVGLSGSEESFQEQAQIIHDTLQIYHNLFDIYHEYDGMVNLKTINDHPGEVHTVDPAIIELLLDCREYDRLTGGKVNAAMGSVLALWHEAREAAMNDPRDAYLPDQAALEEAARHTSWDAVVIDEENATITITDPALRLDVGAIAKGWSAQRVAETAPEGLLISVGGNVCATGPKDENGTRWVIGVENPDGGDYLHTLYLTKGSVVTSGDYQRNFAVEGKLYHHIIDPQTLYPGSLWRAVTVVCPDSGLADALSTALFLLPQSEGEKLLERCNSEAMWVATDGTITCTQGFSSMIRT